MDNATYSHNQNDSDSEWSAIELNCRDNWPIWTCNVANIAGFCSMTMWFLVLLPQLWKNFRRRSVKGLSILWATANFTAGLINIFFIFIYVQVPLYAQITSVYCPVLEFLLLVQFWAYGNHSRKAKVLWTVACLVLWGVIFVLELIVKFGSVLEYAAIFLWSVETFPQIILNMRLHSTSGQSTLSCVIASIGKTTDFIATNGLVMPIQLVIFRYFSSSVAYINYLQVAWYLGNGKNVLSGVSCKPNDHQSNDDDTNKDEEREPEHLLDTTLGETCDGSLHMQSSDSTAARPLTTEVKKEAPLMLLVRWLCLFVLICFLIGCIVGFVWNIGSYYGLFAPVGIIGILVVAKLYLNRYKRGTFTNQIPQCLSCIVANDEQ